MRVHIVRACNVMALLTFQLESELCYALDHAFQFNYYYSHPKLACVFAPPIQRADTSIAVTPSSFKQLSGRRRRGFAGQQ